MRGHGARRAGQWQGVTFPPAALSGTGPGARRFGVSAVRRRPATHGEAAAPSRRHNPPRPGTGLPVWVPPDCAPGPAAAPGAQDGPAGSAGEPGHRGPEAAPGGGAVTSRCRPRGPAAPR